MYPHPKKKRYYKYAKDIIKKVCHPKDLQRSAKKEGHYRDIRNQPFTQRYK